MPPLRAGAGGRSSPRPARSTDAPADHTAGERTALALNIPLVETREQQLDALWAMTPAERIGAMWRGDLTLYQLARWSSRAQHEVPLLGGEFAWIVMRTPEWDEPHVARDTNVVQLPQRRRNDRAAA